MRYWLIGLLLLLFLGGVVLFLQKQEKEQTTQVAEITSEPISQDIIVQKREEATSEITIREENRSASSSIEVVDIPPVVKEEEVDITTMNLKDRLKAVGGALGMPLFIRIFKEESILEVWIKPEHEYVLLQKYPICAYSGFLGPKLKEGDKQAPEGFYSVKKHQLNPNSQYHLSFNLGYPNRYDRAHKRTGSYLMVHGECVSIGCYAMTNPKIEEIYKLVEEALKGGQKYVAVHAFPFYMEDAKLSAYANHEWYDFWLELKEGYDYFESERLPPKVRVVGKRYRVYESDEG